MQKLVVIVLAIVWCALVERALAKPTRIGNHGANELEAYCNKIGGTFRWDTDKYYCVKPGNSGIIVCYWGTNACYADRKVASNVGKTAGPNTRNPGNAPSKAPAKANTTGGATLAPGRVTTTTGILRGGTTAPPAKPGSVNPPAGLGGGAFGGTTPTTPGLAGKQPAGGSGKAGSAGGDFSSAGGPAVIGSGTRRKLQ